MRNKKATSIRDLVGINERMDEALIFRELLSNLYQKLECIVVGHELMLKFVRTKVNKRIYKIIFRYIH